MMYVEAYPVTMTMRVEDERELAKKKDNKRSQWSHIRMLVREQFVFDIWWLVFGSLIILATEQMNNKKWEVEIFPLVFEVVSAFANVGLSMGADGVTSSLCGEFFGSWKGASLDCDDHWQASWTAVRRKGIQREDRGLSERGQRRKGS